jgi:excisionase family DNA binding protein
VSLQLNENVISVHQAANRLGVSPRRVQALLEAGELSGVKVGGHWLVDRLSVKQRDVLARLRGRPFSPEGAWALLSLLTVEGAGGSLQMPEVHRSMLSRLRNRLAHGGPVDLAPLLAKRARLHRYWVQPSQFPRIAREERFVLSGVSASEHYDLDIVASDELEGYLPEAELPRLIEQYALSEFARRPNLLLHTVPFWSFAEGARVAPLLVVLLDMAESEDTRTLAVGREALLHYSSGRKPGVNTASPDEVAE